MRFSCRRPFKWDIFKKLAKKLPQAGDDDAQVSEDESVLIDVLSNDRGGHAKRLFSINQDDPTKKTKPGEWIDLPSGARINIEAGKIVYDTNGAFDGLAEGETATDTFTYTIRLGKGAISTATVTVEIQGQADAGGNTPPTVSDVFGAADEDGSPVQIMLAGEDADLEGNNIALADSSGTLTYSIVSGPAEGSASISGNMLNFDPGADFQDLAEGETRDVTITYQATDAHGAVSGTATVTVTVTGTNDAPTVSNVSGAADEDGAAVSIMLAGGDIDSDDDNGTLTYSIVSGPAEGSASISGNMLEFDPGADFQDLAEGETRDVTITYQATDAHGAVSGTATVTVTVTGTNDAPSVANVSGGAADEDGAPVSIMLAGDDVDSDDDNASLSYAIVSGPAEGSASISGNMLNFDPGADFQDLAEGETRDVSISYQATDAHGAVSGTATVTVTVTGTNDAAQITGDSGSVTEDGTLVTGGTVSVSDVDNGEAGVIAQSNVAGQYGTFSIDAGGNWTYQLDNNNPMVQALNTGQVLMESFLVSSIDGTGMADVDITINGTDDSTNADPVAGDDVIVASIATTAEIPAAWLLQNDTDSDGDTLSVTAIDTSGLPAGWSVTPNMVGADIVSFTLTTPGAVGPDLVLGYTVSDGNGGTDTSTVTIQLVTSTALGDMVDLGTSDYNFSYIEGKAGDDTTGGTDLAAPSATGTVGSDLFIGGLGDDDLTGGKGDDTLYGGDMDGTETAFANNMLIGDETNIGGAVAGDPVINGTYTGGNDCLFGGNNSNNSLYGDNFGTVVLDTGLSFVGGADVLTGGNGTIDNQQVNNTLIGDTRAVFANGPATFTAGNDVLTGGSGVNFMDFSPSFVLFFVNNTLIGDAVSNGNADTTFIGGDDILISGTLAADIMTGDWNSGSASATGGADTFVFGTDNGADIITDFVRGEDVVNLDDTGLTSFADISGFITESGGDTVIDLGAATGGSAGIHTVTVQGVTGLDQTDFDFDALAIA